MRLYTPHERLYASNYAVAKDLFDEKRFDKAVTGPLREVRRLAGDGLFTAYPGEHNWECKSSHTLKATNERPSTNGDPVKRG